MTTSVELATLTMWSAAAAVGGGLSSVVSRSPWVRRGGLALALLSLILAVATWIVRLVAAGHLPMFGTYESALSLAVVTIGAGLAVRVRSRLPVWAPACAIAAALLWHGLGHDPTIYPLTISERSWVIDLHAIVAWLAFAALVANVALATARALAREEQAVLDRLLGATLSLGFFLHSAMLVTGSVYKFLLFGDTWSFDPIETMGFVVWMSYGTLLHMHLFAAWRGRRLARWCIGLFLLLCVSYRGIVYFPPTSTYHIFDMDRRVHVTGGRPGGER